jgi:hypothetical protein
LLKTKRFYNGLLRGYGHRRSQKVRTSNLLSQPESASVSGKKKGNFRSRSNILVLVFNSPPPQVLSALQPHRPSKRSVPTLQSHIALKFTLSPPFCYAVSAGCVRGAPTPALRPFHTAEMKYLVPNRSPVLWVHGNPTCCEVPSHERWLDGRYTCTIYVARSSRALAFKGWLERVLP